MELTDKLTPETAKLWQHSRCSLLFIFFSFVLHGAAEIQLYVTYQGTNTFMEPILGQIKDNQKCNIQTGTDRGAVGMEKQAAARTAVMSVINEMVVKVMGQ